MGIIGGLNFAELTGDGVTDYFGLNTGLTGNVRISKHAQLSVEMLFSQNGEYMLPEFYPDINYGRIRLNHIEIPVHFDWLIGTFQRQEFQDLNLNFGFAYTKLLSYKIENELTDDVTETVIYDTDSAILLQAGLIYQFTQNLGFNLRASLPVRIEGLSWTLASRLIYTLG